MSSEFIPFMSLARQVKGLKAEVLAEIERVIDTQAFCGGAFVEKFEGEFSKLCEAQQTVGLSNGTDAVHLAVRSLDLNPGDEVIVPANSFVATAWGVVHAGAKPVFADCDPESWGICPKSVESKWSARTRAVIGVDLYGQPFDFDTVSGFSEKNGACLIVDAAQSVLAEFNGRRAGSLARINCFSFYPGKNLGAFGEAGAITTSDPEVARRLRKLRDHASSIRYHHDEVGFNFRMDGIQAAVLSAKLNYLPNWTARRREIARQYQDRLDPEIVKWQIPLKGAQSAYHLFVVRVKDRESFCNHMESQGVGTGRHYPIPIHRQRAFEYLRAETGSLPHCEELARGCVSLPMFPELTDQEIERVIRAVNSYRPRRRDD